MNQAHQTQYSSPSQQQKAKYIQMQHQQKVANNQMSLNISELYKQYTQKQHFNNTVGGKHPEQENDLMASLREPDLVAAQQMGHPNAGGMNSTMQSYLTGPQQRQTAQ